MLFIFNWGNKTVPLLSPVPPFPPPQQEKMEWSHPEGMQGIAAKGFSFYKKEFFRIICS